jgi:hypothetical protein
MYQADGTLATLRSRSVVRWAVSSTQISDDLWQRQDIAAPRLSRRTHYWLWSSALAVLIVVLVLPMALRAGAFGPQLRSTNDGWIGRFIDSASRSDFAMSGAAVSSYVSGTFEIVNGGTAPVRVIDITVHGDGFRFDHASAGVIAHAGVPLGARATSVRVAPHRLANFTLYFHITDCHAVSGGQQFATVRLDSWRGIQTARVALPTIRHDQGGWAITSPADPQGVSSVRYLADAVCGIGMTA